MIVTSPRSATNSLTLLLVQATRLQLTMLFFVDVNPIDFLVHLCFLIQKHKTFTVGKILHKDKKIKVLLFIPSPGYWQVTTLSVISIKNLIRKHSRHSETISKAIKTPKPLIPSRWVAILRETPSWGSWSIDCSCCNDDTNSRDTIHAWSQKYHNNCCICDDLYSTNADPPDVWSLQLAINVGISNLPISWSETNLASCTSYRIFANAKLWDIVQTYSFLKILSPLDHIVTIVVILCETIHSHQSSSYVMLIMIMATCLAMLAVALTATTEITTAPAPGAWIHAPEKVLE